MKNALILWSILLAAAVLEVGGDAAIRWGLRNARWGIAGGAAALVGYGLVVNASRLDFSRLLGIYIAVFFVVSQVLAVLCFRERLTAANRVAGALIVAGGLVLKVARR